MRVPMLPLLTAAGLLSGCGLLPVPVVAAGAAVGSVAALGRTPPDVVVSLVTGRDCSAVHLDRGAQYCTPKEPPPETPVFCTRSLGVPDCWSEPKKLPAGTREIADGPRTLTQAQEKQRTQRWPGLW